MGLLFIAHGQAHRRGQTHSNTHEHFALPTALSTMFSVGIAGELAKPTAIPTGFDCCVVVRSGVISVVDVISGIVNHRIAQKAD